MSARAAVIVAVACGLLMSCKKSSEPPGAARQTTLGPYTLVNAFPSLNFAEPTGVVAAPDGSNRLFVLQRKGTIVVFPDSQGTSATSVFLDITGQVTSRGSEQGLLGLVFDPQFSTNGYFYINYTAPNPDHTVIARFKVQSGDPNKADPSSQTSILEFNQPYENHNGGQLAFGPDGYLYIGVGDGGSSGDPDNNAQSRNTVLGKILRIDVKTPSPGKNYSIPSDNPFPGSGQRGEIWAYGLRNPWRFSFDPATGMLWAADVGQDKIEEVDIIQKGRNYGWRIMEGNSCYNPSSNCDTTGLTLPVWEYHHDVGISITGGYVYRGSQLPSLVGSYICGDFGSGRIWALRLNSATSATAIQLMQSNAMISSFGVDRSGEVLVCDFNGKIDRLVAQ